MAEQVAIKGIQLLHKRYTTADWGSHTLQAGELGLNLSTFEVRIGTAANQAWANATPVGIKTITKDTSAGSDYLKDVSFDIQTGTMTLIYAAFTFADDEAVRNLQTDLDALELVVNGDENNDGLVEKLDALSSDYATHKQNSSNAMDALSGEIDAVEGAVAAINGDDTGSSMRQVAESVRDAYNTATVAPLAERVGTVEGAVATKVEAATYNAKVAELEGAIATKVATNDYNAKVEELEGAIAAKVAQTAYDTKVAELEGAINAKVAQSAYNTKVAELQSAIDAKVAQTAYDTKVQALDNEDDRLEGLINTEKGRIDGIVADYETATHAAQTYETIAEANKVRGRVETLEKAGYLTATDKTELQNNIDGVSGKVTTLIGEDANKSVRTIANEELAKQLVAEGAAESLDTLAEIAAWIQSHPEDAAAMNRAIDDLEALVGTLPAGITATTVTGYVTEVKNAVEAEIARLDAEKQDVITENAGGTGTYTLEDLDNGRNIETASLDDITSIDISGVIRIVFGDMGDPDNDYEEDRNFSATLDDFYKSGNCLYLDFPLSDYPNAISTSAEFYLEEKDGEIVVFADADVRSLAINYNGGGMVVKKEHLPADLAYKNEVEAVSNNLTNNYYTKTEVNNALNNKATVSSVNAVIADLDNAEAEIARLDAEKQDVITETSTTQKELTITSESIYPGATIISDVIQPSDISSLTVEGYYNGDYFSAPLSSFINTGSSLRYEGSAGYNLVELSFTEEGVTITYDEVETSVTWIRVVYNTSGGMVVKKEHLPSDIVYQEALDSTIGNLNTNYYTKTEVDTALNNKATVSSVNAVVADLDQVEAKLVNIEETVVKSIEAAVEVEKGRAEGAESALAGRIKAIEDKGLENGSTYAKQADLEATDAIADAAKAQADTNKAAIDVLNGTGANSVSGKINAAITGLNISQYATTSALQTVSGVANAADTLSKSNAGRITTLEGVTYEGDGKVTLAKEGNVVKAAHAATFAEAQTEGFYTFSFDKYGHITGVKAITVLDGNA